MAGKDGGISRAVGTDPKGRGRDRSRGWLPIWPEEVAAAFDDRKAAGVESQLGPGLWLGGEGEGLGLLRVGGAAGAAGEAKAAGGVGCGLACAPWEEAGQPTALGAGTGHMASAFGGQSTCGVGVGGHKQESQPR